MSDSRFTLASGRKIGVSTSGNPAATRLLVFCHPTPGAGSFDPDPAVTARADVRLIGIDRPGYGGSDELPAGETPTIRRCVDDIHEYLQYTESTARELSGLQFGSVGIVGWSFGGAVALAFASCYPELVDSVAIVGTASPRRLRVGERYCAVTELRKHGVERSVESLVASFAEDPPPGLAQLGISDDDPAFGELGTLSRVQHMLERSVAAGSYGMAADRIAARDQTWADRLGAIAAPVLIARGEADEVAGPADSGWYEKRLPSCESRTLSGSGRLAITQYWGDILNHLAQGVVNPESDR